MLGPVYFKSNNFYPTAGRAELIRTTTSDYAGGNEIKSEVNYVYDSENLYLKSTGSKNSKGEEVATSYTYPEDMISSGRDPNGVYQQMISKNIINAEIEVIKKNGIQQLSLQRKNYFNPYPNVYVPQTVEVKNADNPAETRLRYYAYDISGKPLTILKEADNKITYIWGYNNQYIVAKIEGEDYNIAKQYINQTILNNAANYTDDQIRIETNKLRQNLTKALVTTYTYNPFGEISSQCDANNRIIYYEYDPFGRLKLIRDQNKKIIKTFDYKYQQ